MAESLGKRERRKSLGAFGPLSTTANPGPIPLDRSPTHDVNVLRKRPRRNSGFFGGRNPSPVRAPAGYRGPGTEGPASRVASSPAIVPDGPRSRRKSLQKKRTSVFGSLRSLHSLDDDEPTRCSADGEDAGSGIGSVILHHGEIQTTGGMWRKKSQYLVLTDTHLVRFKSLNKAMDMFPSIPPSMARTAANRQSVASISSLQDPQLCAMGDASSGIPLNSIVAVYMLDDGKPSASVEVAYMNERAQKTTFIQMQTPDLQELNLWMVGIRSAAEMTRGTSPMPFEPRALDCVVRMLEYERDYDPESFHMFRVIQMASSKSPARASSDELTKLSPSGCYLALGIHKLHIVALNKISNRSSTVSLNDLDTASAFGLMNLTSLSMEWGDDSLHLTFRIPLQKPSSIFLASVHSLEIAYWVRQQTEYLRPLWVNQPYSFIVPRDLSNESNFPPVCLDEDYGCFDRTLVAYCASYGIDTSNIRYTIDTECGDAPCFKLLRPASACGSKYTPLELIALMRALRYNESFRSISFSGVSLDPIQGLRDLHGIDKDAVLTRANAQVYIPGQENLSVLSQEVRALTLKSKWLRRLDFSHTLSRTPQSDKESHDPGCGIPEAIFPICRRELTSVDWVVLNGIKLGDSDLDYLVDAASQRGSHLRALEVGNCGLSAHDIDLLLSTTVAQVSTLEAINISGVQGRIKPEMLQQYLGYFGQIRRLDLSRISRTSGPEPLIPATILFKWRLEELSISRTAVNRETVDSIATYLASDKSERLRVVRVDQCGLTGQDVAIFLHSLAVVAHGRNLHLHADDNRLDLGCSYLCDAIAQDKTPSHLSMRMIDFKREEQFQNLAESLRKNRTLKYLDISKASLPYDAGPETCKSLQLMFEENDTLEDLNISGESAHLDVARFGIGLNLALTGLKKNKSLKVLRIEHQKLGLQGANTLASVLENNTSLLEIYCENNDINLQSFTVLVNGLQKNRSLLSLSCMDLDRTRSLDKVRREIENVKRELSVSQHSAANSLRRSLHAAINVKHTSVSGKLAKHSNSQGHVHATTSSLSAVEHSGSPMNAQVEAILQSLSSKWDAEVARLRRYLFRNYNLANGIDESETCHVGDDAASDGRPATAASLGTMLEQLELGVTLSISDIQSPGTQTAQLISETSASSHLEIFQSLDTQSSVDHEVQKSPYLLPKSDPPSQIFPSEYATSGSSTRSGLPVPVLPSTISKSSSIRSARSSSTVSTSTGTGVSARSAYGTASSTLRGFLSSRERKKLESMKSGPVCVSVDKPPTLDWSPPQFDLGEFPH